MPLVSQDFDQLYTTAVGDLQWFLDGEVIPGASNEFLTLFENGSYTVQVTNDAGCSYTSEPFEVLTVGLAYHHSLISGVHAFPNPYNDLLIVDISLSGNMNRLDSEPVGSYRSRGPAQQAGRNTGQDRTVLHTEALAPGTYQLLVLGRSGNRLALTQVVKL